MTGHGLAAHYSRGIFIFGLKLTLARLQDTTRTAYVDDDWAYPRRRHRRDGFLGDDDWDNRARRPYHCEVAHRHRERYSMDLPKPRRTSAPPVLRSPSSPVARDIVYSDDGFPTVNIYNGFSVDDDFWSIRDIEHDFPRGGPSPPIRTADAYQVLENLRHTPPIPIPIPTPGGWPAPYPTNSRNVTALNKAIEVARTELFVTLTRRGDSSAPKVAILNLATAQRLVLSSIQHKILSCAHDVITRDNTYIIDVMGQEIKNYCEALRNLEYMQEHSARHAKDDDRDPFYLKSSKYLERLSMEDAGLLPHLLLPNGPLPVARDHENPQLPGMPRTVARKIAESEQLWIRFGMASAGGLVLIGPMLIMANLQTKTASLVTTCIAMVLFAAGITFGTQLKPDQVLGATAAYAAVLVVFVGTSFST